MSGSRESPGASANPVGRAEQHHRAGDTVAALRVIEEGLARRPAYVSAQVARARYLLGLGRAAEALEQATEVLLADPSQLVASKVAVRAALAIGDRTLAHRCLERYTTMGTKDPEIDAFRTQLAALRPPERTSVTLGLLYLEQGHRREAREIFERILAVEPDNERARQALARAI